MGEELLARIDRLESLDAIRQLVAEILTVAGYARPRRPRRPVRSRTSASGATGPAVRTSSAGSTTRCACSLPVRRTTSAVTSSSSADPDHAFGVVYSKNEHETGGEWVIMQMLYWDDYERIDGAWYFRRRLPCYWYATDINKPPIGDRKMRWPGASRIPARFTICGRRTRSSGTTRPRPTSPRSQNPRRLTGS